MTTAHLTRSRPPACAAQLVSLIAVIGGSEVSRLYLYRLIKEHAVPVVMVGSHRRLRIHDVLQLREQRHQVRRSALDELSALGQELQVEAM